MKVLPNVFTMLGAVSVAIAMLLSMVNLPVQASETCPSGDGWVKIEGLKGTSFTYEAKDGKLIKEWCYKAGSDNGPGGVESGVLEIPVPSYTVTSTFWNPPKTNLLDLSHASFLLVDAPPPPNTPTPTDIPEETPTPTDVPQETPTPTDIPQETPTPTDVPQETPTPTDVPQETPTPTDVPQETPTPTDVPGETPTPTDVPTATPTTEATPDDPGTTPTPTDEPPATPTPSDDPTATPVDPGTTPTPEPTDIPEDPGTTPTPSTDQTPAPTTQPTLPIPVTNVTPQVIIPVTGSSFDPISSLGLFQKILFNFGLGFLGFGLILQAIKRKL